MASDINEIILDELREHRRETRERLDKINGRVRKTEEWQANANGKMTILSAIGMMAGGIVAWLAENLVRN